MTEAHTPDHTKEEVVPVEPELVVNEIFGPT